MSVRSTALVLVVSAAAVAAVAQSAAHAGTRSASDAAPAGTRRFFDTQAHVRPLDLRRGPFFGLRVHSLDVGGNAETLSAYEYVAEALRPGAPRERYDLVRTLYRVNVAATSCDEVMGLPLPASADVRAWKGWMGQTRWMRRDGPADSPVGGFVGRLQIAAAVGPLEREIGVLDVTLAGTTGMRPMRGDPDDATTRDEGRCTAPRHDEGWYVGRVDRKALLAWAREAGEDAEVVRRLRVLERSVLAGTFEGRLDASAGENGRVDYGTITAGRWWFDGLLAWEVVPTRATDVESGATVTSK